jgi:lipoprotein|nr:MAG TPA: Stomatin alpha-beta, scaffolding protein, MEMBRANE [Caudoviricetes sp.]
MNKLLISTLVAATLVGCWDANRVAPGEVAFGQGSNGGYYQITTYRVKDIKETLFLPVATQSGYANAMGVNYLFEWKITDYEDYLSKHGRYSFESVGHTKAYVNSLVDYALVSNTIEIMESNHGASSVVKDDLYTKAKARLADDGVELVSLRVVSDDALKEIETKASPSAASAVISYLEEL